VRKKIAEEEGVPVYAIFTNAQLAEIVKREMKDLSELATIEGIGKTRIEKYGERLFRALEESS